MPDYVIIDFLLCFTTILPHLITALQCVVYMMFTQFGTLFDNHYGVKK